MVEGNVALALFFVEHSAQPREADEVIELRCCLLRCMSPVLSLNRQTLSAVECPLLDQSKQRSISIGGSLSAFDP
jgi:hypothetical protein